MTRNRTILLVEDNPDDAELTLRAFEKSNLGGDFVVARDGADALDYLFATGIHRGRDPSRAPGLILLDLNLPKVHGLDVLKRIRAERETRWLPVVVLTSSKDEADIGRSYDLGANSFVRKPVDFIEFLDAVRQLSRYWLDLNQPPPRVAGRGGTE